MPRPSSTLPRTTPLRASPIRAPLLRTLLLRTVPMLVALLSACALCGGGLLGRASLEAAPDDAKAPKGSSYRNASLGVSARSPVGWKMIVDNAEAPSSWKRLVTFNDRATDAQAVLSVRPRTVVSVDALMAATRRAWNKSRGRLRLDSIKKVDASPLTPIGKVIVEGSFSREAAPKPAKDGVAPPPAPAVSYRVQATYLIGPGHEFLLYAQGQRTHWSRLRAPLRKLAASIRFTGDKPAGARGVGSYRSDAHGFSCKFPQDYTVVTPQRTNHVVSFEGLSKDSALLSVYAFSWEKSVDKDAERLVIHYEEDKGGSASIKSREVAGQEAVFLTAQATLGGVDRTILLAILKRGDTCFRLRASMPKSALAAGTSAFETFVDSFRFHNQPK